jgi:hypothetical protein
MVSVLVCTLSGSCGPDLGGSVWCLDRYKPADVRAVDSRGDRTSLIGGDRRVRGIRYDRTAWCWGYNYEGQLGAGITDIYYMSNKPVRVHLP